MSTTPVAQQRRVRHQAREAVTVMAVSIGMSSAFALALLVVSRLGAQG